MKTPAPGKTEIALMPPFVGLTLEQICVPQDLRAFTAARAAIMAAGAVGFDTESKPTFSVGEVSSGPHLVQFALPDKAYLFQMHHSESHPFLRDLLQSAQLIKAGFGLKSDSSHIHAKLGIKMQGVIDLNAIFSKDGYQKEIGVRTAVGLMFGQRFVKSKHATTSNWARHELTPQQLLYAANDAYGALKVYQALQATPGTDLMSHINAA